MNTDILAKMVPVAVSLAVGIFIGAKFADTLKNAPVIGGFLA